MPCCSQSSPVCCMATVRSCMEISPSASASIKWKICRGRDGTGRGGSQGWGLASRAGSVGVLHGGCLIANGHPGCWRASKQAGRQARAPCAGRQSPHR